MESAVFGSSRSDTNLPFGVTFVADETFTLASLSNTALTNTFDFKELFPMTCLILHRLSVHLKAIKRLNDIEKACLFFVLFF